MSSYRTSLPKVGASENPNASATAQRPEAASAEVARASKLNAHCATQFFTETILVVRG
jgi:hypothetical protein